VETPIKTPICSPWVTFDHGHSYSHADYL